MALSAVFVIGLLFAAGAGIPYFLPGSESLQRYTGRGAVLLFHIVTGAVALLSGPVQLWLGITDRHPSLHRRIGLTYITSISLSAIAAYYLALNTDLGLVFGGGLMGLATAWLVTTWMAFAAIRRQLIEQHREWMVRSYVVTTAFVMFRIMLPVLQGTGAGTLNEQLGVAAWTAWAVPLLITEAIIQGRKILAVKPV